MKALQLQGPWAAYEQARLQNAATIQQLGEAVEQWRSACQQERTQVHQLQQRIVELEGSSIPDLQNQLVAAQQTVEHLQQVVVPRHQQLEQEARDSAAAATAALQSKLDALGADNTVLKTELQKAVQLRQATHNKVEEARKRLGLNHAEAEYFIREWEDAVASNKALKAEVASLAADKARLEQQCDSRAAHTMTLIADNKRLLEQVSELRKQAVVADQDLWALRQELASIHKQSAKTAKRREASAAATKARPEWQSAPSKGPRGVGQDITNQAELGPCSRHGPDQQRQTKSIASGRNVGATTAGQAGKGVPKKPVPPDAARAVVEAAEQLEAIRSAAMQQALALRQQRLATHSSCTGP